MDENLSKKRPPPISFRPYDEGELRRRAAISGLSVSGYINSEIFSRPPPRRSRIPHVNTVELARFQGLLGRVSNNLNQCVKLFHINGYVELPELITALNEVSNMSEGVMKALGYSDPEIDSQEKGRSSSL